MLDDEVLLECAETFIHNQLGKYVSDLQRVILINAISERSKHKTYEQIGTETGYSGRYIKQVVAPQIWQLLSDAIGEKVKKNNVRTVLERYAQSSASPATIESLSRADSDNGDTSTSATATSENANGETERHIASLSFFELKDSNSLVLLVDDEPQNLTVLSELLENEGYQVRQALNGALALKAAIRNPPDLVLLDVNMPEMNGYEVCRQLKADHRTKDIPVIFVSALNEVWNKVQAFSVGGADYVTKPLKAMEVVARIENQLEIRRSHDQISLLTAQSHYAHQVLQEMGILDPVVNLVNRAYFDKTLPIRWQKALHDQHPLSLMLCQIVTSQTGAIPSQGMDWSLLVPTLLNAVAYAQALVASYADRTVAILLSNADFEYGRTLTQAIHHDLNKWLEHSSFIVNVGGIHLEAVKNTPCSILCDASERVLHSINEEHPNPVFQPLSL